MALVTNGGVRDHPAQEVYVTGTFDDWSKSVKLEKRAGRFEKLVELTSVDKKIDYKVIIPHPLIFVHLETFVLLIYTFRTVRTKSF